VLLVADDMGYADLGVHGSKDIPTLSSASGISAEVRGFIPMDDAIGRTIATIRDEKLEENTLVIFFSDSGGPTMLGTTINGSSNGPLRGSKRQTWEGGIRVPFIIRWTGHVPEGTTETRPIIQLDVLPTALAAAGIPLGSQSNVDGVNLLPSSLARIRDRCTRRFTGDLAG
jgi:arylsulfatase A-like enzyme